MHDGQRDGAERAEILPDHIGHGRLPYDAGWNTTQHAAFEDMAHEQIFDPAPADEVTHLAFRVQLAAGQDVPPHDVRATWVTFLNSPGIEVDLSGMAWRSPRTPWVTHEAGFTPPIDAAIEPENWRNAVPQYTARFDEIGALRPGQRPRRSDTEHPFAGREADIAAMASKLMEASHRRGTQPPLPPPPTMREVFAALPVHQQDPSQQQGPRLR
ncbi:hypothetical protein [Streptomyces sp. NPDC006551]|uniref:hypothetical protein n=1 Tax=Streptomyces sp. NPDC006551 TaxID=3157178 RepID=UPI0033B6181A